MKAGKTKVDPVAVRARYRELRESGEPRKSARAQLMTEFEMKSAKTLQNYLR